MKTKAAYKTLKKDRDLLCVLTMLNEKQKLLLAADFGEQVLHIFEAKYPKDKRARNAIKAKRQFANGEISKIDFSEAMDAAKSAAWSALYSGNDNDDRTEQAVIAAANAAKELDVESASSFAAWSSTNAAFGLVFKCVTSESKDFAVWQEALAKIRVQQTEHTLNFLKEYNNK